MGFNAEGVDVMRFLSLLLLIVWALVSIFVVSPVYCGTDERMALLPPSIDTTMSLEEALSKRQSTKAFLEEPVMKRSLSQLLWSAAGVNRKSEGKRTHPSAMAKYSVSVYVCDSQFVSEYLPISHSLRRVGPSTIEGVDVRQILSSKDYAHKAPVQLVFVGDISALPANFPSDLRWNWVYCEVGTMIENVHLQCAALGLGTAVNAGFSDEVARKYLKLEETRKVLFILPVGHPDRSQQ